MAKSRSTVSGDVVLIHYREQPASFARVEAIRSHERSGWFYCDLLILAVPTQPVTWILQQHQIDGTPFTMGGEGVRLERLPDLGSAHVRSIAQEESRKNAPVGSKPAAKGARANPGKVVSLFPRESSEADRS
jgi:hypothetical protein